MACYRFYERWDLANNDFYGPGFEDGTTARGVFFCHKKRIAPAVSSSTVSDTVRIAAIGTDQQVTGSSLAFVGKTNQIQITYASSTVTTGQGLFYYMGSGSGAYIEADAEL
jgi:hypothetical protein